jgi:hypothetical protein
MKVAKRKRRVTAKRKKPVPAKQEHSHEALERRTLHWFQHIEAHGGALLAQNLMPSYLVLKNHGSNTLAITSGYGNLFDLPRDAARAVYVCDDVAVENRGAKSAVIEFDFLPIFKK